MEYSKQAKSMTSRLTSGSRCIVLVVSFALGAWAQTAPSWTLVPPSQDFVQAR